MHRRVRGIVVACPLVVAAAGGCSSSSGGSARTPDATADQEALDASGEPDGIAALCSGPPWNRAEAGSTCASSFPLTGGISTTLSATGCGYDASGGGEVTWSQLDASLGFTIEVAFHVAPPLQPAQTGQIPVDVVTIREWTDAGATVWSTPAGACTVTVGTTVCLKDDLDQTKHDIYFTGSGTCTKPAAPQGSNAAAPITIGPFTFQGFTPCIDSRGFSC